MPPSLFLRRLKGVADPEQKRKIIGRTFIEVFEQSLKSIGHADFLAQGTLYPDVIESVAIGNNPAALIKSHHNVGGLPARMKLRLIEPLRELFKDEVRAVGARLGLPRAVVWRQPFPGPGLGVRVLGEITRDRLDILRHADAILQEEMMRSGWYWKVWQSFCVFLPVKSVGVVGDERNYAWVIARARRREHRRDDGRLDAPALRPAAAHLQPHHQRGARGQPGGARHQFQAAGHHRMGIRLSRCASWLHRPVSLCNPAHHDVFNDPEKRPSARRHHFFDGYRPFRTQRDC